MTASISFRFDDRKLANYLLNPDHPVGKSKAKFFLGRGFKTSELLVFAECLALQAKANWPGTHTITPYGIKHAVAGQMETPRGQALVLTVWLVDTKGEALFVTARPYAS